MNEDELLHRLRTLRPERAPSAVERDLERRIAATGVSSISSAARAPLLGGLLLLAAGALGGVLYLNHAETGRHGNTAQPVATQSSHALADEETIAIPVLFVTADPMAGHLSLWHAHGAAPTVGAAPKLHVVREPEDDPGQPRPKRTMNSAGGILYQLPEGILRGVMIVEPARQVDGGEWKIHAATVFLGGDVFYLPEYELSWLNNRVLDAVGVPETVTSFSVELECRGEIMKIADWINELRPAETLAGWTRDWHATVEPCRRDFERRYAAAGADADAIVRGILQTDARVPAADRDKGLADFEGLDTVPLRELSGRALAFRYAHPVPAIEQRGDAGWSVFFYDTLHVEINTVLDGTLSSAALLERQRFLTVAYDLDARGRLQAVRVLNSPAAAALPVSEMDFR